MYSCNNFFILAEYKAELTADILKSAVGPAEWDSFSEIRRKYGSKGFTSIIKKEILTEYSYYLH